MTDLSRDAGPILVTCTNFTGLVNPLSSIAAELVRQGHQDVWFCTNEERAGEIKSIEEGAIRFASLGPTPEYLDPSTMDDERYAELHPPSRLGSLAAFMRNANFGYMDAMYERMLDILDEVRPAVVFSDSLSYFAIDAAVARGVPYVLSHANPPSQLFSNSLPWTYPTPLSGLPRRMTFAQRAENVLFRLGRIGVMLQPKTLLPAIKYVGQRRKRGMWNPGMMFPEYVAGAKAIVGHSVFGFEYPFAVPDKLRMYGAMVPPERDWGDGELKDWLDRHESVVFIGFGTMMRQTPEQVRAIVEAARLIGPDTHLLWKLPKSQQHLLPADLSDNLRIEHWVPSQLSVLEHPHVRVFFNQAGGNATHEGLYFGKPMLMLPFWLDCLDFAARGVDAGAALAIADPLHLDPHDIAGKLIQLLTCDGFRRRAEYWGERLREAGGIHAAASLLIDLSEAEGTTFAAGGSPWQAG